MGALTLPTSEADFIAAKPSLFGCPRCSGRLARAEAALACEGCGRTYANTDDIPRMFVPNEWEDVQDDVTDRMKQF